MKLSLENIKWLLILGLIAYIVLLQQCKGKGDCPDTTSSIEVTHTTHTDTIPFIDTIPRYVRVDVPTPKIYYDTLYKDTLAFYVTEIKDTLIEGIITSKVKGLLISQELEYIPLFPKYIHTTDSIFVKETVTQPENKLALYIGGDLRGSQSSLDLAPRLSLKTKNDFLYSYSYGILTKTHSIGIQKRLSFKKKDR